MQHIRADNRPHASFLWYIYIKFVQKKRLFLTIGAMLSLTLGLLFYNRDPVILDETQIGTLEWNARFYEEPGKKWDDFTQGKSCVFRNGQWDCMECVNGKCKPLKRRGICKPFGMFNWDAERPRKRSHFRTEAFDNAISWVTTNFMHPTNYEQAPCTADLTLPCFDLMRCPKDKPMNVYVHNLDKARLTSATLLSTTVELASKKLPGEIALTTNPDEACLFVVAAGSYKTKEDLLNDPIYMSTR